MRLGISSEAALDAPVDELVAACERRGLGALGLVLGTAIGPDDVLEAAKIAADVSVRISGIVVDGCPDTLAMAALSRLANAPIIVRGDSDLHARIACTSAIVLEGGSALAFVSGSPATWLDAVVGAGVEFAWHIDETCQDPAADAAQILRARPIRLIRLAGGGPELSTQNQRGIGDLMRALTLAGYDGPLIMTPSSQRYRVVWSAWLGRRGGWGCGSKTDSSQQSVPIHL